MPEQATIDAANEDLAEGKSPSTAAGEFVRQEIDHVREGKHGVKNAKQAIAIGLSEARRAGVDIPDNPNQRKSGKRAATRKPAKTAKRGAKKSASAKRSTAKKAKTSAKRSRATKAALKRLPKRGASKSALSRQAKQTARKRGATARSASAKKAARTRANTAGKRSSRKKR